MIIIESEIETRKALRHHHQISLKMESEELKNPKRNFPMTRSRNEQYDHHDEKVHDLKKFSFSFSFEHLWNALEAN
jgi:hypothetical protein